MIDALETIKPSFPKLDDEKLRELALARAALEAEPNANKNAGGKTDNQKPNNQKRTNKNQDKKKRG